MRPRRGAGPKAGGIWKNEEGAGADSTGGTAPAAPAAPAAAVGDGGASWKARQLKRSAPEAPPYVAPTHLPPLLRSFPQGFDARQAQGARGGGGEVAAGARGGARRLRAGSAPTPDPSVHRCDAPKRVCRGAMDSGRLRKAGRDSGSLLLPPPSPSALAAAPLSPASPPRPPQELEQSARREREREAGRGRRAGGGDFGGARRSYLDDVGSGQEQRRMMRPDEGGGGGLKWKERERAAKRAEDRRRQVRGAGRPGRAACAIPQVLFWDSSSVLLSPGRPEA
jgi:hypothetical protein